MTTNFVLSGEQFDGLAAGYGSASTLTTLRRSQLAKRRLLLSQLIDRHDPTPATELLYRAEAAAPEVVERVLHRPHLDAWAVRALRTGQEFDYLAQVAAAAAIGARLTFEIGVPTTHGEVYLPGLGAAEVRTQGRVVVRREESGAVTIGPVTMGGPGWAAARSVSLEPGLDLVIEDQEPFRDTYQWRPRPRLDDDAADRFTALLREAWQILTTRHPEHAAAMRILLRVVVPLRTPPSGDNVSAASRQASGSVAVAIPATAEELSLLLLHEFMHMKLDALRDLVDLHHEEAKGRYPAPWRMDPRPVGPLMQGIYAHAGVTDYWRLRRRAAGAPPVADVEYAYWGRQNWLAIETLAGSGELTPLGQRFVAGLRRTLESWQPDGVPPAVAHAVDRMVLAQTIRWRLRNWRPAESEVSDLLAAWRSGRPPSVIEQPGILRADGRGEASGIPGIVGVLRHALAGRRPEDAADQAYLDGDVARAARLYAGRLDAENSDDALVGLALAAESPIVHRRPDLLRALVRRARSDDPAADPAAMVAWLRSGGVTSEGS